MTDEEKEELFYHKQGDIRNKQELVDTIQAQKLNTNKKINEPFKMLSSPVTDTLSTVINSSDNLNMLSDYSKLANTTPITVETNGSMMRITSQSKQNTTVVELPDYEKFTRKNSSAKLFYRYILTKLTQPNFFDTDIFQNKYIRFNLQELVDLGAYSRKDVAKRAYLQAEPFLKTLWITGEVYSRADKKKKSITPESRKSIIFFKSIGINKSEVELTLNDLIDWNNIKRFYTLLPRYVFDADNSEKAQDLATLIYQRGRQATKQIKEKGYFTITNQYISNVLNLPLPKNTKNPDRDIKQAILSPVDEINKLDDNIKLVDEYNKNGSIQEFLEGSLYVYIPSKLDSSGKETNQILEYFTDRAKAQEQEIQKAVERKERIISKAIADKTSKKDK